MVNWSLFKHSSVSLKGTEHFQAPFGVIIFGSIQIEHNQKTLNKGSNYLAALKVLCYQPTPAQTERLRDSSCKHCKTALTIEKDLAAFLACYFGVCGKLLLFSLLKRIEHFMLDFGINHCLDN